MNLQEQFRWLEVLLEERIDDLPNIILYQDIEMPAVLDIEAWQSKQLSDTEEITITLLALASSFMPSIFDIFKKAEQSISEPSLLGCFKNAESNTYHPTTRTALFLLAGKNIEKRIHIIQKYFKAESRLFQNNILKPFMKDVVSEDCILEISPEFLYKISLNQKFKYTYSSSFPASLYQTDENWDDLVLNPSVRDCLMDVKAWMKHYPTLNNSPQYKGSKGFKALFWGESGTGKTVSVGILGKEVGRDVYRIDLSQIVSKYVGETEKNLKYVFDLAQNKDWILFFDEGDALLGKRTDNKSANDRYGNQEIAYLLQRMEDFDGILFLCTNKKDNLDEAFKRRFQLRFEFSQPSPTVRYEIWIKAFEEFSFNNVPIEYVADKLKDMNGAWIKSFARFCKVQALEDSSENAYVFDREKFFRTLRNFYIIQGKGYHDITAMCKELGLAMWKDIIM
ncbi:MAG: ATP-binding protein [Raineya sp.]|jgi:hypothetical protein|nr:ATP-binding protein [Raineya sp.]